MPVETAFWLGTLGAFLLNIVRLAELSKVPKIERPPTVTDWVWWVNFLGLPLVGGALAALYVMDGVEMKPLLAANIGISAPVILKGMTVLAPDKPQRTD